MIIFNIFAIAVGLIIALVLGPLFWLFPHFMSSPWGTVLSFGIVTVIGFITDQVGLKGRLFFLPIWVLGLAGMGFTLHGQWGWAGPAAAVMLVVLGLGVLLGLGAQTDREEWAAAPGHLEAARDALSKGDTEETWAQLAKAYFVPAWGGETPERCRHNLAVLTAARQALAGEPGGMERRVFDALTAAYQSGLVERVEGAEKLEIPSEISAAMKELLVNKGVLPEEDRSSLLQELEKTA